MAKESKPSELEVIGDWNDAEAAALAAMDGHETVILTSHATSTDQTFELLTILDQPGRLVAHRATDRADLIPIRWTCSIGRFPDPTKEREILTAAAARMKALAGVDFRPR